MLYLDCRMLEGSGISTYLSNLIQQFRSNHSKIQLNYLVRRYSSLISQAPDYPGQHLFQSKIYSINEQFYFPKTYDKNDLLHIPHYNAPLRFPGKLIVTVHDLCHLVMKEFFKGPAKRFYANIFMAQVLKKASRIITVSHFTESEILKHFNVDPKKISVIPNGLDPHFFPRTKDEQTKAIKAHDFPESYLLYVGNIKRHKNITRMIQGYHLAWEQNPNLPKLIIVGVRDQEYDPLSEAFPAYHEVQFTFMDQVIFKGYVPYKDLPSIYSGAEGFLFPSLYEGFGFPPLEAMACGTAVIASNISSLPETLNGNALFVDPYDVNQISSSILKISQASTFKEDLIKKGLKHVQRFSWEDSAEKHLEVYRQLESKKRNILFVDQYGDFFGGGQVILRDLIQHTHEIESWKVMAALPSFGNFALQLKKSEVPVLTFKSPLHDISQNPLMDGIIHFSSSFWHVKHLIKICRDHDISILYCNGGRIFLMSWIVAKLFDVKVIWHIHLILQERQKWLVEIFGKNSNIQKIITVSETAKSVFQVNSLESKMSVLYNWVSPDFIIESGRLSRKQKYPKIKLITLGRISPEKGQLLMLQSIKNLKGVNFEITFAGNLVKNGNFQNNFFETVELMKFSKFQINLPGFVDDVKPELLKHDFLVMPSKAPEALPLSVIEAFSTGLIVIANPIGSLTEMIEHRINGLFYDADDPQSLPNLIHEIQDQKYDLVQIRKNAHQMVKTRFYAPKQLARFQEILEETV